jgi:hypothetical protein
MPHARLDASPERQAPCPDAILGRMDARLLTAVAAVALGAGLLSADPLLTAAQPGHGTAAPVASAEGLARLEPRLSDFRMLTDKGENLHNVKGRDFDLFLGDADGKNLERVTRHPDFDGCPMFSPDDTRLVLASNRNQKTRGDTNIFIARWKA